MNSVGRELVWELLGEEVVGEHGLPPGFRFHPTDEELVTFYLASKVFNGNLYGVDIVEVDLNRCEPWELPEVAKMGEREWYFYSLRDRKYPTGLRTNRATGAGYWKATGKDREVHAATTGALVGMKKTLVFYKGRAPRGEKTRWVLHEYRLYGDLAFRHASKEEWVICRIFHKGGEKKSSCFPTNHVIDHQTLEIPMPSLLQTLHHPLIPQTLENPLFPSQPIASTSQLYSILGTPFLAKEQTLGGPTQEESFSNWLESMLQNASPSGYGQLPAIYGGQPILGPTQSQPLAP
ncbi:hypothetical protein HPP92_019164 [Vanilla planifolia]|uniref:NAC domain-containing protein n=1 Tax=Vanilla planifolia TaxID=51239 RepID=A0A835Q6A1_VANPL|nr:hypothetical protein HPP92_019164 [Vanilla planifolia]